MPTPTIKKPNQYFDATTYTGTGATQSITNAAGFSPDFVWVKGRSGTTDHALYDSVRGTTKQLESNTTTAETTESTGLTAFGTNGFTVGALAQMNTSAATYVAWQWQAGKGSTSSNTSGSITSTVSVSTTAGFSIVTYTGNGTGGATVGHGLGVAPAMIIAKGRTNVDNWPVGHTSRGWDRHILLNSSAGEAVTGTTWNNTAPTSTVFTVGTDTRINQNTIGYVAYCFAEIAGFSKFGSYTGNFSTDGPFVYTGFRPKFVMIKCTNDTINWLIWDSSRSTYNLTQLSLRPNLSDAEADSSSNSIDILSNGFKIRNAGNSTNDTGRPYIYMAFAEAPFKYANAR